MSDQLIGQLRTRVLDPERVTDSPTGHAPNRHADEATLMAVEGALRARFPEVLRRAYLEVGDGNWGPGYGLLPLMGASYRSSAGSVLDETRAWAGHDLIYVGYNGCTVFYVLDAQQDRIGLTDLDAEDGETLWAGTGFEWLDAWTAGVDLFFSDEDECL